MIKGLYTSAVGMTTQMKRMDVVTNNIANADTTGFKRDIPITQSFSHILQRRLDDETMPSRHDYKIGKMSLGLFIDDVSTDFSSGSLYNTGGALDLAIAGDGFFAVSVQDKNGEITEQYTRDGSFTLTPDRRLSTKEGNYVAGNNGDIVIPEGELAINAGGAIFVDGQYIDSIKLVDVQNKESLRKTGDNLYKITEDTEITVFVGELAQGYLENSNTNAVREMVEMISLNRVYEANQRVITAIDSNLGRAVNDIARK